MKIFENKKDALAYAGENLGKYDSEFVMVNGVITYLTSVSIPLEERFRNPIEDSIRLFLKEAEQKSVNFKSSEDIALSIGAEVTELLQNKIIEKTGIDILCAYNNF